MHIFGRKSATLRSTVPCDFGNLHTNEFCLALPSGVQSEFIHRRDYDFGEASRVECQLRFAQARDYLNTIRDCVLAAERIIEMEASVKTMTGGQGSSRLEYLGKFYAFRASLHAEGYRVVRDALIALGINEDHLRAIQLQPLSIGDIQKLDRASPPWMWQDLTTSRELTLDADEIVANGEQFRELGFFQIYADLTYESTRKRMATF